VTQPSGDEDARRDATATTASPTSALSIASRRALFEVEVEVEVGVDAPSLSCV